MKRLARDIIASPPETRNLKIRDFFNRRKLGNDPRLLKFGNSDKIYELFLVEIYTEIGREICKN